MQAPPEEFLYLACLHEGTGVEAPDFLAVVDAEEGRIVHETPMPNVGDELHHFGWNRCSSACHGPDRSHLIVPGFRSSRIHIVNVADDPRGAADREGDRAGGARREDGLHAAAHRPLHAGRQHRRQRCSATPTATAPAASRCSTRRRSRSRAAGRTAASGRRFNYDFWYQPRKNVLISSEFGEPNAYEKGFDLEDVGAGRYGQRLHFWNLAERRLEQTIDLGEKGLVPLEVRWLHDPDAEQGFVGATLSSNIFRFHRSNGSFRAEPVIEVENEALEGWPLPGGVPGLITDVVLSMDDRFLYFSNWLHGDLRQYDVSDPANPRLTGQLWLGGLLGKPSDAGRELSGGPQMIQLSLDGRRLYVTNSLYSTWDNQFYPGLRSWLMRVELRARGRHGDRPATSSSTSTTAPTVPRAPTRCASRAATARRRSSSDRRALRARRRPPNRRDPRVPRSPRYSWGLGRHGRRLRARLAPGRALAPARTRPGYEGGAMPGGPAEAIRRSASYGSRTPDASAAAGPPPRDAVSTLSRQAPDRRGGPEDDFEADEDLVRRSPALPPRPMPPVLPPVRPSVAILVS